MKTQLNIYESINVIMDTRKIMHRRCLGPRRKTPKHLAPGPAA